MFKQQYGSDDLNRLVCPDCKGTRFRVNGRAVSCTNCDWVVKRSSSNKYGARKTEFNGKKYDSKFEASVAEELELRKKGNDILDYDIQYVVEVWCYRPNGLPAFKVRHKVDFRIHHKDGSFELYEAKGVETDDYKWRRKFIEHIFLPDNPDHTYTVVKQRRR